MQNPQLATHALPQRQAGILTHPSSMGLPPQNSLNTTTLGGQNLPPDNNMRNNASQPPISGNPVSGNPASGVLQHSQGSKNQHPIQQGPSPASLPPNIPLASKMASMHIQSDLNGKPHQNPINSPQQNSVAGKNNPVAQSSTFNPPKPAEPQAPRNLASFSGPSFGSGSTAPISQGPPAVLSPISQKYSPQSSNPQQGNTASFPSSGPSSMPPQPVASFSSPVPQNRNPPPPSSSSSTSFAQSAGPSSVGPSSLSGPNNSYGYQQQHQNPPEAFPGLPRSSAPVASVAPQSISAKTEINRPTDSSALRYPPNPNTNQTSSGPFPPPGMSSKYPNPTDITPALQPSATSTMNRPQPAQPHSAPTPSYFGPQGGHREVPAQTSSQVSHPAPYGNISETRPVHGPSTNSNMPPLPQPGPSVVQQHPVSRMQPPSAGPGLPANHQASMPLSAPSQKPQPLPNNGHPPLGHFPPPMPASGIPQPASHPPPPLSNPLAPPPPHHFSSVASGSAISTSSAPNPAVGAQNMPPAYMQQPATGVVNPMQQGGAPGLAPRGMGAEPMYSNPNLPPGYPQAPGAYQSGGIARKKSSGSRIDPNQIPSPVTVMQNDQEVYLTRPFLTGSKAVPPLASTNFTCIDDGNASPRFMRFTMYNIPVTEELLAMSKFPLALLVQPLAETSHDEPSIPVVDMGPQGPIRCRRCKAYICPYFQFVDGGRRFSCNFCNFISEVPQDYFCNLDHTGRRHDIDSRPELLHGSVEFVATSEYCARPPNPISYIFLIDVSYQSVQSGMLNVAVHGIRSFLDSLPVVQRPDSSGDYHPQKVGIITFDKAVHFYNISSYLSQPQMLVVSDIEEMFLPVNEGILVNVDESRHVIDDLLDKIQNIFSNSAEPEPTLGSAIEGAVLALKDFGGKIIVFQSALSSGKGSGKLENRDNVRLMGTDKEKSLMNPQIEFYRKTAENCVEIGVSVDMFLFSNSYMDVATIGQLSSITGGELFRYPGFKPSVDGNQFVSDLTRIATRPCGYEALIRIRCSTGLRATEFYGNMFMRNASDMEFSGLDSDKCVAVRLKYDDKLEGQTSAFIQCAVLYTTWYGHRRIRVHNFSLKTCTQLSDVFRHAEMDVLLNMLAKQAVHDSLSLPLKTVRDQLTEKCVDILTVYRRHIASQSSAGQLILPEALKLLPVYTNCLLKSDAFRTGTDMTIDERMVAAFKLRSIGVGASIPYFYPRVFPLHSVLPDESSMPPMMRASYERLEDHGVYLVENGLLICIWIGRGVAPEWIQKVFGVPSVAQVDTSLSSLPVLDNPLSDRISGILNTIRLQRKGSMKLCLVRAKESTESKFMCFMVEDKCLDTMSYVDFLCFIHRQIQAQI
eukprot:Sdes_comp15376_c0_seq1m4250